MMPSSRSSPAVWLLPVLLLLGSALVAADGNVYGGFDCGQGSAILVLASHKCTSEAHQHVLSCFNSLALRVRRCSIKAWPHPHHGRKQACWGVQMLANVTDVNTAQGALHLHGSGQHLPVQLEYRRPDEAMHVTIGTAVVGPNASDGASGHAGACTLVFDVRSASEASLHPVPGEDGRGIASLLGVLLPAVMVPCLVVALIVMAVGSLAGQGGSSFMQHAFGASAGGEPYEPLEGEPDGGPGGDPRGAGAGAGVSKRGGGGGTSNAPGGLGLLKAMSRRARSRRMRRSCRPAYVGLPEQSAQQHREYVSGRLQPGPFHLVAPFFKFPPVAVPPALEAIPESNTPTCSSRASSAPDLSLPMPQAGGSGGPGPDVGRRSPPALDYDDLLLLMPDASASSAGSSSGASPPAAAAPAAAAPADTGGSGQATLHTAAAGGTCSTAAWVCAPPLGDAEEGGAAAS